MTGYTSEIIEKNLDFAGFALCCARAFGACISLRDEDPGMPIPERFEPSDYSRKEIEEATQELKRLGNMPEWDRATYDMEKRVERRAHAVVEVQKMVDNLAKFQAMRGKVAVWIPPTDEHRGLKKFMLEQLDMTIDHERSTYWDGVIEHCDTAPPLAFWQEAYDQAKHDIEYYEKAYREEIERVDNRNDWIRNLRESLQETQS